MVVWHFFLFHVDYGNRLLFVARPKKRWALSYIWNFSTLRGSYLVERKTFSWLCSESIHVDDDDVNVNGEKFSHHVNTLQRCSRVKLFDHSRECHLSWNLIVTFQTSLCAGARWWSELPRKKKRQSHSLIIQWDFNFFPLRRLINYSKLLLCFHTADACSWLLVSRSNSVTQWSS